MSDELINVPVNPECCGVGDNCKPERREADLPPQVIGSVLAEDRRSPGTEETKKETGPKAGDIQLIANKPCIFNGKTWVDARVVVVDGG